MDFVDNQAKYGGGISLMNTAKIIGISNKTDLVNFVSNIASRYGGAFYVDDESNPDMCAAIITQQATPATQCFLSSVMVDFSDNFAGVSGSNLFGGLLDRCKTHSDLAQESYINNETGFTDFQKLTNIDEPHFDTISSHPVRLCFCRESQPYCDYHSENIQVNRRKQFSIELIAYDHNGKVNATVDCYVNSSAGGLGEGQEIQNIKEGCTKLHFNLFTPLEYEGIILSVRGPCTVYGISERNIGMVIRCECPIGFQISNSDEIQCDCECHQVLRPYQLECDITTESIIRRGNFWITYLNQTTSKGYVIYPNCPFDYCYSPAKQVMVNLNLPNGSDAQCSANRSGLLCGTCKPGFSVSLGSSHCLRCPFFWPGLLILVILAFIFSGIGLVALILVLNLTVVVGTLNAIIFYANILLAMRSAFFSTSESSFASVFISWLNLNLGFETCFYNGMDMYVKTWLQLTFPTYMIFLVAVLIMLSNRYTSVGRLIGKCDLKATLATLLLLSHAKFLQATISAFLFVTLTYPDGSTKLFWLPDPTVEYLSGKHVLLFVTAVLILLVGLFYTILLFSWHWLHIYCPRKWLKYIKNLKISSFLELYYFPYEQNYRYWTGLLLFVRVVIYLVSTLTPFYNPIVPLLSATIILSCIFVYMGMFGARLYKHWFVNVIEIVTYFNVAALSIFTWYTFVISGNQVVVTNISVGITLIELVIVLIYHTYKFPNPRMFSRARKEVLKILTDRFGKTKQVHHDYQLPQVNETPVEPTYSTVELPKHNEQTESATVSAFEGCDKQSLKKSSGDTNTEIDKCSVNVKLESGIGCSATIVNTS